MTYLLPMEKAVPALYELAFCPSCKAVFLGEEAVEAHSKRCPA
jgi:hypothetical protein